MSGQRHTAQIARTAERALEPGRHIAHGGVVPRLKRCRARPNGIFNAALALAAGQLPNRPATPTHDDLTHAERERRGIADGRMLFPGARRGVPVA
jgi:hypothetical protein